MLQRAVVGISESTRSDLNHLLREVKKEQGAAEMPMSSGSSSVFSRVMPEVLPAIRKRLSRDSTLDALLQKELQEKHEKSYSNYHKLQVCTNV